MLYLVEHHIFSFFAGNSKYLFQEYLNRFVVFFSGFRSTGPFVVMIYTMIRGDLLRFCLIFFVFMAGFSQGLHVLFVRIECENDFATVIKTFFRMFCVTLQQIADAYKNFYLHPNTGIQVIGKVND
jgi:hypothetical protein